MKRSEAKLIAKDTTSWQEEVLLRLDSLTWTQKQTVELLGQLVSLEMGTKALRKT